MNKTEENLNGLHALFKLFNSMSGWTPVVCYFERDMCFSPSCYFFYLEENSSLLLIIIASH